MVHIGLDARMIHSSGIGSYIQGLLSEWQQNSDRRSTITPFGDTAVLSAWSFQSVYFNTPVYSLKEQWKGARLFNQARLNLLHIPHYNVPLTYQGRLVVTIHDVIHLLFPRFARRTGAWFYARTMLSTAVKKATRIITVSHTTKNDILHHFSIDPDKIRVIYSGVAPEFTPLSPEASQTILSHYGLTNGFILFVGDIRPHKNLEVLLKAHKQLKAKWPTCPPLVIIGKTDRAHDLLSNADPRHVVCLGRLSRKDLVAIYSSAGVLAFPSLYEGFGLPPLEAMACGCPVVVSEAGALPESVGEAGLYVNPRDPGALAEAIMAVLKIPTLRQRLIALGLAKSREYSWQQSAQETWKVYEEALA